MTSKIHDLITSYIDAVGEGRLEDIRPMLDADAEFTFGDTTLRGSEAFVGGFRRLAPIIKRNEIRKVFVEGDEACVIYDFVTDTPAGPVLSVEYLKYLWGPRAAGAGDPAAGRGDGEVQITWCRCPLRAPPGRPPVAPPGRGTGCTTRS